MPKNKLIKRLLPTGTTRRLAAKKLYNKFNKNEKASSDSIGYDKWIDEIEPRKFIKNTSHEYSPLISIVVPCFNTPVKYLEPLIKSIINQTYPNWELCLADGSTKVEDSERISAAARQDKRIKYIKISKNLGIVGNTNKGIDASKGEFVAFLDHDDTLSIHALNEVASVLNEKRETDIIYSDEDKLTDDGSQRLPHFFKPGWSPELLLGVNYITHLFVVRKKLLDSIGGIRVGFDGAQDYDLLLRLTEKTDRIEHIDKILYHWRLADGSTAKTVGEKDYATIAGQKALRDAVKRRGIKAEVVEIADRPTNYRLRYLLPTKQPKVSIIIPFKDKVEYLKKCVPSILEKSKYNNFELILISNNSEETDTRKYLQILNKDKRCKILEWNKKFNYAAINNYGRQNASGEYLIFLNNDTKVVTPDWINELIGVCAQPEIGAVGPLLRYPDSRIQHSGVVLGMGGMAGHVFRLLQPEQWTLFGLPCWPRNYLAVTGACLAIEAAKFDQVGGFDEQLTIGGNDVALGISLYESGYRNVYWPIVEVVHYENVSVGPYAKSVPIGDYERSLKYYKKYLEKGDPYFNPNLDLMSEQIKLRSTI